MLAGAALFAATACAPIAVAEPPIATVALSKPMTWADLTARPRPVPDKSFRYGSDPYQVVDLWRPAGRGPHPVVLMVHGGCWTTSIADRGLMAWAAADLRARGIAVWNIDYRGFDRTKHAGVMLSDVNDAVERLITNGATEGLDLARIVPVGHSAGGHLALWLAGVWSPSNKRSAGGPTANFRHVVSLGGLPDVEQAATPPGSGCGMKIAQDMLETLSADELSVLPLLPLGVPQTLINGEADRIIPTHYATDYAAKARKAGDEVTVTIVPNQGHVELIAPGTPAWTAAVRAIERALRR